MLLYANIQVPQCIFLAHTDGIKSFAFGSLTSSSKSPCKITSQNWSTNHLSSAHSHSLRFFIIAPLPVTFSRFDTNLLYFTVWKQKSTISYLTAWESHKTLSCFSFNCPISAILTLGKLNPHMAGARCRHQGCPPFPPWKKILFHRKIFNKFGNSLILCLGMHFHKCSTPSPKSLSFIFRKIHNIFFCTVQEVPLTCNGFCSPKIWTINML